LAFGPSRLRADTVKLKDGTVLEGNITAEDDATLSIYLEFARGTIIETRRIHKADIAEVIRWTPEQWAEWQMKHEYEKLQKYQLNPHANYMVEYYDQVINNVFREYLKQRPNSPYASNVTANIVAWRAERDLVVAGNVKLHGRWSPAAEAARTIGRQRAERLLQQARVLISQGRFESAVQQLQLVVHMDEQPELVSQAKPLFDSACQQAASLLNQQRQKLEGDVLSLRQRVERARRALSQAEALQPPATNGNPPSIAQAAVESARTELDSAQNHLAQVASQLDDVVLRLITLKSQASAPMTVQTRKSELASPPTRPADTFETLAVLVAWLKKNWLGIALLGVALLFLLSRSLKD
jgi:tetratricopeptide (TPR) repeat protein